MTQPDETPAISMSNTKKEMFAAYEEMKAALAKRDQELADATEERETWRKKAAEAAAERAESDDPVRRIHELRSDIGRQLTDLAGKFESETEEYSRLKQAVGDKKAELERIYQVETAASDLAALIEANRKQKEDFEEDIASRRQQFEDEVAAEKTAWEREKQEHEQQVRDERAAQERERKREQEEYDYNLKREREQRQNKLEDEMAALEKEVAAKREQFQREQDEKQEGLAAREQAVTEREQRMDDLQAAVDAFPTELEQKVAAAVAETTERLNAEFASREALLKKEFEGERNVLNSRIEALEALAENQEKRIDSLTRQQEAAYEKVQDIANKAVSSAGDRQSSWRTPERHSRVADEDKG